MSTTTDTIRGRLAAGSTKWWGRPLAWAELFAVSNLAFLAVDIALAHSANAFENPAEWIPVFFSAAVTPLLMFAMLLGGGPEPSLAGQFAGRRRLARWLGLLAGWCSIAVGVAGLIWHLDSDFFQAMTLKNLVYTAPFSAPLAYTGLGLLLILNRMLDARTVDWARWVGLLAAGGFAGNFVLCLADHAQNGFFLWSEWTGVVAGAVAFGFLIAVVVVPDNRPLIGLCALIMLAQVVVALVGFVLHGWGNLGASSPSMTNRFVYGAPIFAPLLFADLALLAVLGLWAQSSAVARERTAV
jgi:hypothetical protein